ncbi:hypothetical protein HII27_09365 [Kluyvera sp. SCKS090646]|uniref:Tail fiber protein n=1 Tax=Kluyvera sichuanensis TaxID=2725494 RepID=A0ABR6RS33_9ENTR|nr:hypothetical protein [Kluyvera sichuanensis]MBC1185924.1 hypothetical protein [Kluyvera sichuanensis]
MSAGTLKLTNGSTAVTGTGTTFTADMTAADVVVVTVGGTVYSLAVDSVTSDTALVLTLPFTGPTASGVAWQAVPRKTMLRVTAELNKQVTEALRFANENAINWQAVLSSPDTVNVLLPDGTTLTGFSWRKINDLLNALDVDHLDATAAQIHTDAQQVATDKAAAVQAKTDAETAKTAAVAAQGKAETAQAASETAQTAAVAAQGKAETAQTKAETAQAAAESAAASIDATKLLQKDQNLADLDDPAEGRSNLSVYSKAEIDAKPSGGGYIGQSWWHDMRSKIPDGCVAADGQQVDQSGPFADLYADVAAGNRPTTDEATWQADPTKRGCYVLNSSAGKMRLPDRNGVQSGSIKAPVLRGDGGTLTAGSVQKSGVPNLTGDFTRITPSAGPMNVDGVASGIFRRGAREATSPPTFFPAGSSGAGYPLEIDLSLGSDVYQNGLTEARMNSLAGCFVIRYAGRAQNAGSLDAMTLSARMESINTDLLAKSVATNARIGYTLLSVTNPALGSRTVLANPFGNGTPVWCMAEIFHATLQKWVTTPLTYASGTLGTSAWYAEGEGIVLKCGYVAYVQGGTTATASSQDISADYKTPSPVRIHVFKVTA